MATLFQILAQVALISGTRPSNFSTFWALGVMVGFVLDGAATLQARVLPRWCGVGHRRLPIVVAIAAVLGENLGAYWGILFGLLGGAGVDALARSGAACERPARLS